MPYTEEPPGLCWINNLNTTTFGSLVSQICWLVGSVSFTALAAYLMTRQDEWLQIGVYDANGVRQWVLHSRETIRGLGNNLAGLLLAAWTGKTIAGVITQNNKRKTSPEYAKVLEAKERGKAAGVAAGAAAAALVTAAKAGTLAPTKKGRGAVVPAPEDSQIEEAAKELQWADGRKEQGIL